MQYILILFSSVVSAAGNYLFLGGLGDQRSYILALSISSSIAGFLAYGILPQIMNIWDYRKIGLNLGLAALFFSGIIWGSLGVSSAAVFLMIFVYINGEILLSQSGDWSKVHACRLAMLVTGFLSWVLIDQSAILLRGFFIVLLVTYLLTIRIKPDSQKHAPKGSGKQFILLVFINLIWVYVVPLIIVFDVSETQTFLIYLISTVSPLIYFKAQDVIFKVEIIGPKGSGAENRKNFLLFFAVPLSLAYLAAVPLSAFEIISSSTVRTAVFSGLSILLLFSNYSLTKQLSKH